MSEEPDRLIEAHLAGELDEELRGRLRAWLLADREHLRRYLRDVRFDQDLAALTRARAQRHEHGYASTRIARPRRGPALVLRLVALAALIALSVGGWLAWQSRAPSVPAAPAIALVDLSPHARVMRWNGTLGRAVPGDALAANDQLVADGDEYASVRLADGTLVTLRRGELAFQSADGKRIALASGLATIHAAKQAQGSPLVITTGAARAEVVGTSFTIASQDGLTTLAVSEGTVAFTDNRSGERRAVPAGQRALAGPVPAQAIRRGASGERPADPYLGVELAAMQAIAHEPAFVDAMQHAQPFQAVAAQGLLVIGAGSTPGADDWPSVLEPGRSVAAALFHGMRGHYQGGTYTCLYSGRGELDFAGDARVTKREPGRLEVEVTPSAGGMVVLQVASVDAADPLRGIHLIAPGCLDSWRAHPFLPSYLARWRGCGVLRAQNWEDHGRGDQQLSWRDRHGLDSGPREDAVAPELMFALAHELDADLWLTIPVESDDSYVAGLAELARRGLGDHRRVYVEYGHEVWNPLDSNSRWVRARGLERGHPADLALARGYVDRALEVFAIWKRAFGDDPRLVRVLNFGNAEGETLESRLAWHGAAEQADALALCLSFGQHLDPAVAVGDGFEERSAAAMRADVDALLASLAAQRRVAHAHGLRLIGYGAGPEPAFTSQPSIAAQAHLIKLADSPAVGAVLAALIRGWREQVGDVLCCDLPNQLIQLRATEAPGQPVAETRLATYQALIEALPRPEGSATP